MTAELSIPELRALVQDLIISQREEYENSKKFTRDVNALKDSVQILRESAREDMEELKERFKETDKRIKKAFDLFESQWGKLMESLVEGDLVNLLNQRGIEIRNTTTRLKGERRGENYEFDIIAHNGEEVVIVEVKTTLRSRHVKQFLQKLKKVKAWIPDYKHKKVYGAVAYLKTEQSSEVYAQKQKLFAILATGDSASIINSVDFQPKVF